MKALNLKFDVTRFLHFGGSFFVCGTIVKSGMRKFSFILMSKFDLQKSIIKVVNLI